MSCFRRVAISSIIRLKPIEYDEYKDMKTRDIAALVKERIEEKIKEILG